jgi:outer membrane receptor protein involved in Fe transport
MLLRSKQLSIALGVILWAGAAAWSQITTGSLSGTVQDGSSAIVVNTKIEVLNQDTGVSTSVLTNQAGLYKVPFLTPGKYSIRAQAPGFRTYESKDVEIQLSRESVINITLEVGSVSDTVQVEATVPIVQSDTAQLSLNVDSPDVTTLPGVQGGLDKLALISPGVVVGFGNINSNGLTFSANGQRARSNNFLLDGQDNNDPVLAGPGYLFSNLDAVGEYEVITNQYSAEYGRNAGAIVNVRVKQGTNSFHGDGSYLRRDDQNLTALDNIQRRSGLSGPPKNLDTVFGGQLAGPIVKDRLFFNLWVQREWQRTDTAYIGTSSSLTPTPNGLKTLKAAFPNSTTVQNLAKYGAWGSTLGNPTIVSGTTTTKTLQSASGPVSVEFSAVKRVISQPQDNWDSGIKADYRLSDRDLITGKFYRQENTFQNQASNGQAGYYYNYPTKSKQLGGSWVRTLSPSLVNEFRFSYVKNAAYYEGGSTYPFSQLTKNIANVSITGGNLGYGLAYNMPQYRSIDSYQYQDNVSKQLGRHSLKFGTQILRDSIESGFLPYVNGVYSYTGFQNYVDNVPASFNGAAGATKASPKETDQAYYFQDDFKLRPNLTVNLGVRYEYSGQPLNLLNDVTTAREQNASTALWDTTLPLSARTYPRYGAPAKQFAPRIGFAWSPSASEGLLGKLLGQDKTVFRGGYSIAYDPSFYNLYANAATAAPVVFAYTLTGANAQPMPSDITGANLQTLYSPPKGKDPRTLNQTLFDSHFRSPYSQSFSFGLQRRLGNRAGFEARYVGTRGVALFASRNGNPYVAGFLNNGFADVVPSGVTAAANGRVNGNYGNVRVRDNSGSSTYHGLQTSITTRSLRDQLTFSASYTFSKTIDNISEVYSFLGSGSIVLAQDPFNVSSGERGLSNNNVPHAFSLNATWEAPWLKHNAKWYGRVAGGWTLGVFDVWQAGHPMTPVQASTSANVLSDASLNSFVAGYDTARPFLVNKNAPLSAVGTYTASGSLVLLNNTSQQVSLSNVHWVYNTLAADKVFGTPWGVGRNTLTAPVYQRADLSLYKNFAIGEHVKLALRAEATNAFNHAAYLTPNLYIDSGTTTTFLNPTETEVTPRVVKIGAKIVF